MRESMDRAVRVAAWRQLGQGRAGIALGITIAGALLALPALASSKLCGVTPALEDLAGAYVLTVGPGTLYGDGKAVPLARESKTPVTLSPQAEGLLMEGEGTQVKLGWVGREEPDWEFDPPTRTPGLSSDDLERALGCGISALPRLIGHGQGVSEEGLPVEFTYRLIVVGTGPGAALIGGLTWSSGGITMISRAALSR